MLTTTRRLAFASVLALAVGILSGSPTVLLSQPASDGDTPFAYPTEVFWPGAQSVLFVHRTLVIQKTADERLRRFPDSPHSVGWLWQARRFDDALDLLQRLIERQAVQLPTALAGAQIQTTVFEPDEARRYKERLRSLAAAARAALPVLHREQAAKVAAALIPIEFGVADPSVEHDVLVDRFIAEYPGTEAARLLEVNRITRGRVTEAQLDALDALAAEQPGTAVAAKARYLKGFHLARNWSNLVLDGANPDPTESFLELLDIVADLESGRYPPCIWVDDAPRLVTGYFMFQPRIAPENATRMMAGVLRFAREHPALAAEPGEPLTFLLSYTMARVAAFLPDGPKAMERALTSLEQAMPDAGPARLARAEWLATDPRDLLEPAALAPPSPTREADIRALLAETAGSSNAIVAALALASLGEREFADPTSRSAAIAHYREYERRFPSSANRWVASLRAGQAEQALGRHQDAVVTFVRAADTYAANPLARALALAYAGRIEEERGDFGAAARHYGAALGSWTADMGDELALDVPANQEGRPAPDGTFVNRARIQRAFLELRVAEIGRSLPVEGGQELERGRWLLAQGRAGEATEALREVSRRFGAISTGAEARAILGRARLDAAVDLAATEPARKRDALKELDSLAGDPGDPAGGIAGIVAATLRMLEGDAARADTDIRRTLQSMAAASSTSAPTPPGSLEADVLAIRDAVFLPLGHAVLSTQWNGTWPPATLPPFVTARSILQVTTADGARHSVDVSRRPPGLTSVLFLTIDDEAYLAKLVTRLGGTGRRVPQAVMEVPNQPTGGAARIVGWWNRFFPTRPGHWAGVEIMTYPAFSSITFTNAERTRALVPITVVYSGATVVLEKVNGVWTMKELLGFWIT